MAVLTKCIKCCNLLAGLQAEEFINALRVLLGPKETFIEVTIV